MKKILLLSAALISFMSLSCESAEKKQEAKNKAAIETQKGKFSYAVGVDFGKRMNRMEAEVDLDLDLVLHAIKDRRDTTRTPLMNDSQVTVAWQEFMVELLRSRRTKDSLKAEENLVKQAEFLQKNKEAAGIVVTESGLQYIVLTEGSGELAQLDDTVSVHYAGSLLDGSEFDDSFKRNRPIREPLKEGRLIKGWIEMLQLMKKGQKVKVWIPANLGYGPQGNLPVIPGNSLLIYEMDLLEIKPVAKK